MSDVVRHAVALVDPTGADDAVRAIEESYEDDDRPVSAAPDLAEELASVAGGVDPDGSSPGASLTVAAAIWLSTNPGQEHDRERVLREGTRLLFQGKPPEPVADWLSAEGIAT